MICSTGHITPVPTASSSRPASTTRNVGPTHASSDPTANTVIETMTICRVVKRRVRNAVSGTITPMTSWKIDVSHCPVVTEMPNSDTMVGSAADSCSCVKLPTNVMNVKMASEARATRERWPFT